MMGWIRNLQRFFKPHLFPEHVDVIIFGLGNPGDKYTKTRHNIGFRVAEAFLGSLHDVKVIETAEAKCFLGSTDSNKSVLVVKPLTFMNQSGVAVKRIVDTFKVQLSSTIVIVDDFNIPLGTLRARKSGSSGGHNGLKSIEAHVGADYPRLRIGIGPLPEGVKIIDFVLGEFLPAEEDRIKEIFTKSITALNTFIAEGIETVMSKHNK